MKKFILCFICLFSLTASAFPQNGTQLIYNSGNYGIALFESYKPINSGVKNIFIQHGLYNISSGNNPSGNYYRLNKSTGLWYTPFYGFINAAWGVEYPYGYVDCKPIPAFAVSWTDTNHIFKYSVTPAASCPDARSFYTTNGGVNYAQSIFGSGGVIIFSSGIDYNPKNPQELLLGFRNLQFTNYNISKSTNGGINWTGITNVGDLREQVGSYPYTSIKYGFLKYNPFDTAFVYANGINKIHLSSNGGYHFDSLNVKWMKDIVFSYRDSALYGYNDLRLYRSTNKGLNWDSVVTQVKFSALEINPDNANILYGGDSLGVSISTNRGSNWTLYNNSFSPSKVIIGLSKDPGTLDTFYAVTTKNVYKVWAGFIVGGENGSQNVPAAFSLSQNYPNPFNPVTKIKFEIPENGKSKMGDGTVTLKVYDLLGKEIKTLVNESLKPGTYEAEFDGSKYPSGIYFYKLSAGNFRETKKMILIK